MRLSRAELIGLIATGDHYAILRKDDFNRDDIRLKREDGRAAGIQNYPYRIDQLPTYIFDELVRTGVLQQDGIDEEGAAIFRVPSSQDVTQAA